MAISKYQSFIESSSINGANAPYVEAYYEQFLDDPESIDPSWRAYFRLIQDQNAPREVPHSEVIASFERRRVRRRRQPRRLQKPNRPRKKRKSRRTASRDNSTNLPQIGRAHVCTPVTYAHRISRLKLEKKKHKSDKDSNQP